MNVRATDSVTDLPRAQTIKVWNRELRLKRNL